MSLLEQPEAQTLLADAIVTPDQVRGCQDRLTDFLRRYLPRFYRVEQRTHATLVIRGLLSDLQRKSCEPIAVEAGVHRKPVQTLVGAGKWDDEAVMAELRGHVRETLADPGAILVLDPSGFPKSGTESCGVARPWCGRLGKQDNCQIGVFLISAAAGGYAPLDRRLYLPKDWATDPVRRGKCHVPEEVEFQESWRIGVDLLERCRRDLPHAWVSGDDEPGRPGPATGFGDTASGTCSRCPATPTSATWSAGVLPDGVPAGAASGRCGSAGPTPGRRGNRTRAGPG